MRLRVAVSASFSMARKCSTRDSAEGGEGRTPAGAAAMLGQDDGLVEAMVQIVHQQPGAAIGHAHGASRRGDGAMLLDQLQETRLARADGPFLVELDAQRQLHHGASLVRIRGGRHGVRSSPVSRQQDRRARGAPAFQGAVGLGGVAERVALADLDMEDAAAERVEQPVGDRAHLRGRAGVMAEIRAARAKPICRTKPEMSTGSIGPEAWP